MNTIHKPGGNEHHDSTPSQPQTSGLLEQARQRVLAFVAAYGADFSKVLGTDNKGQEVDLGRRKFVMGAAATAGLGLMAFPAEAGTQPPEEMTEEDLEMVLTDFAENPEKYAKDTTWLDIFISLNFFDIVGSLARKEDSSFLGVKVGKASVANLLLQGVTNLTGLSSVLWSGALSDYVKDFDHEFPHTNVVIGVALNLYRMGYSPEAKAEVKHGFHESEVGVLLLLFLTSLGKGIQTSEAKFIASIREGDKFRAEESEHTLTGSPIENMDRLIDTMAEVIGAAPMAAALSQLPLTAFGNAQVARDKLLTSLELSYAIFEQLLILPPGQRAEEIQKIQNPVIRKIVNKQAKKKDPSLFEDKDAKEMAEVYMEGIGVGMLSGMMDTTQAAFGDAGPSIVGAYQSFGAPEMLKTAFSNVLYTYVMGYVETMAMARRLGVPVGKMMNKQTRNEAREFANRSLQNVMAYMRGIEGVPSGARFGVGQQLGNDFGSLGRMVVQSADHAFKVVPRALYESMTKEELQTPPSDKILTRKVVHILEELFDQRNEFMVEMSNHGTVGLDGEALTVDEAMRRANWVSSGMMSRENAKNGAAPHEDTSGRMGYETEEGVDVDAVMRDIEAIVRDSESHEDEKRAALLDKLHEFHHLLDSVQLENARTGKYVSERVHELMHTLEKDPSMLDLFRIEYWEHHLGAELAETAFVVFAQGIHIVGLTPSISKATYGNSDAIGGFWDTVLGDRLTEMSPELAGRTKEDAALLGSMTMHAGLSSVADNWADEIIHSKQLPRELFFPDMAKEFGLDLDEMGVDYNKNVTEQFLQFTESLEAAYESQMRTVSEADYERIYDRFKITKFMAILSAVFGGGESMIGNSPHFSAIVKELKNIVTLGGSFADVAKHFEKHAVRLGLTFVFARYIGPMIEDKIFGTLLGNPFHPKNRKAQSAPSASAHH